MNNDNNRNDVLISVKPRYATQIFDGRKTVELRRRKPGIPTGARVWIYVTTPVAALQGYARLDRLVSGSPAAIWKEFADKVGVSKSDFEDYFLGCESACALVLSTVRSLERPLTLHEIKERVEHFHPPQFYCYLNGTVANLRLNSRKTRDLSRGGLLSMTAS